MVRDFRWRRDDMRLVGLSVIAFVALSACRESNRLRERPSKQGVARPANAAQDADHAEPRSDTTPLGGVTTARTAVKTSPAQERDTSSSEASPVARNDVEAAVELLESPPSDPVELGQRLASAISDPAALSDEERRRISQAWQALNSED